MTEFVTEEALESLFRFQEKQIDVLEKRLAEVEDEYKRLNLKKLENLKKKIMEEKDETQ